MKTKDIILIALITVVGLILLQWSAVTGGLVLLCALYYSYHVYYTRSNLSAPSYGILHANSVMNKAENA